jgi:hypothetical protein
VDNYLLLAGIVIITMSLMLHLFKRQRLNAERQAKFRAAAETAKELERKLQLQTNKPVKNQQEKSYRSASDRMTISNSKEQPFNGGFTPRQVAKWELEIDQLGRQWTGTLDSKMIALQTLTQEANRVANRMELLLEQFELLVHTKNETKSKIHQTENESYQVVTAEEKITQKEFTTIPSTKSSTQTPEEFSNLIPANKTEYPAEPFVLDDLETEIDRLQQQIADGTVYQIPHATILKINENIPNSPSKLNEQQSAPDISFSTVNMANSIAANREQNQEQNRDRYTKPMFSTDSVSIKSNSHRITVSPSLALAPMGNLSFDSLYDDQPARHNNETIVATPPDPVKTDSRLDLQKQIEMLDNYGYSTRQIAQSLNITVGEVDLILKLKGEK